MKELRHIQWLANEGMMVKKINHKDEILRQIYKTAKKLLYETTTSHLVITEEEGQDFPTLFEDIQNKYNLYDNCTNEVGTKPETITIEIKNAEQMKNFRKLLERDFSDRIDMKKVVVKTVPMEDSIIDDDRKDETGGYEV